MKYTRLSFLFFVSAILLSQSIYSQDGNYGAQEEDKLKFESISRAEGLASASISFIFQDSRGFLWIGTAHGLHKYDGYQFSVLIPTPYDTSSICSAHLLSVFEDHAGILWFGCTFPAGLSRYDPAQNTFTNYIFDAEDPMSISGGGVHSICEDHEHRLWVGTENGLNQFIPEQDTTPAHFIRYQHNPQDPNSLSNNGIRQMLVDNSGDLWIGTNNGLNRLTHGIEPESDQFKRFKNDAGNPESLSHNMVLSMCEDPSGDLWIGTPNGLNRFVSSSGEFIHFIHDPEDPESISNNLITALYADRSGELWLGTYQGGLNRLKLSEHGDQARFVASQYNPNDPESLSSNTVTAILKDNEGVLWVGTNMNGINKFDPQKEKFKLFPHESPVFSICVDSKDFIWLGTGGGGVRRIDRSNGNYKDYTFDPDDPSGLSNNTIMAILEDQSGNLWFGNGMGGGIHKLLPDYNPDQPSFIKYQNDPSDPSSLSYNDIICMYEDRSGIIWIGTWGGGLNKFDPKSDSFKAYRPDPEDPESISSGVVTSLIEDPAGNLWIGTFGGGLNKFDPLTEKFTHLNYDPGNQEKLSSSFVNGLLLDQAGNLWVGVGYGGLTRLVPGTGDKAPGFSRYTEEDGLPDALMLGILEDDQGNIWCSTARGLSKLDLRTETFTNYTPEDGLNDYEFNFPASYKSDCGELFFGGIKGCNAFTKLPINPLAPQVEITEFKLFNKTVSHRDEDSPLNQSIEFTDRIKLTYKQNFLAFDFLALSFSNPDRNQYKYQMINLDPDTIYAGTRRFVEYPDLKPGKYTFWVTGSNGDGVWNEEGRSIEIIISPPWYKADLAYGSYGVIFLLSIFAFINWRTRKLENEKKVLEKQVKERTIEVEQQKEEIASQRDEVMRQKDQIELTLEQLRQTQDQLVQAEKMASLGELVAGVAHEINTPVGIGVTAVSSLLEDTRHMAELYKTGEISRSDFKEFLQSTNNSARLIQKNLDRTAELVQSFKQVSVDQATEEKRDFLLKDYLEDIIRSLYPKFKGREIGIRVDCPDQYKLNSYPGAFAQLFTNLIMNSLSHGFPDEAGGHIDIQIHQENGNLNLEYRDNGKGIPEEILPKIFDPFFTTDQGQGTGLGLNIVYNIVTQKLKGNVTCESVLNKGVAFKINIPLS